MGKWQGKRPLGETRKMRKDDITIEISCECGRDVGTWPVAGLDISGVTIFGFCFRRLSSLPDIDLIPMCSQTGVWDKERFWQFHFHGGV